MTDIDFFHNKRIFVTGHTGFKGIWLCKMLVMAGAKVTGFALNPPTDEGSGVFKQSGVSSAIKSLEGDIRDYRALEQSFNNAEPEIVIHLAAQPIVRESYKSPLYTYETNIMGTVNLLECIRNTSCVKSLLNVTTDKVYENKEWDWGYRECDRLDGFDPYSNSKSCSELVTHCYKNSFFASDKIAISTARAGNVIGGGDFAIDRIIPDCIRAAYNRESVQVRNPHSIRPYQHVLEPLCAYLMIVKKTFENPEYADCYNIGSDDYDCVTTGKLVDIFCNQWGEGLTWKNTCTDGPHEANFLKLDCSKIKRKIGWQPMWHIDEAIKKTIEWAKCYRNNGDIGKCMEAQINEILQMLQTGASIGE